MTIARTFDADNQPTGVLRHILPLFGYPRVVWQNRYMVQNFFRRELMGRFHGSYLGAWWMLVQPVFLFAAYYLVFGVLWGNYKTGEGPDPSYAIYLFSGIILFHSLVETSTSCCNVIVSNGNLVKKVAFPSEVLPIHIGLVGIVLYLVGALVCFGVGLGFGALHLSWLLLALPLVLLVQFVFGVGLGLLLANANVFIRDTAQLWRIFTTMWMFLTPVFWPPTQMIDKLGPEISWWVFHLNPGYSLVQIHRMALGGENVQFGLTDFWGSMLTATIWSLALLVLGYSTFVASKHKYSDVV